MSSGFRVEPLRDSGPLAHDAGALRREAGEQGYLFFPGAVEPEALVRLRRRILERCAERGWLAADAPLMDGVGAPSVRLGAYGEEWVALQCEVAIFPEFVSLRRHPFVLSVLERLFGTPPLEGRGDVCRLFSPAASDLTTPPHQDRFYVPESGRLWTVWVPLGDCPLELGGLAVLPCSHRLGLLPHGGERQGVEIPEDRVWATGSYRCGDVVMFSSLTLHRACENATRDRLRISADFRYVPSTAA